MSQKSHRLDANQWAAAVVAATTGEIGDVAPSKTNLAKIILGRKGGLKGGKARAKSLSSKKRKTIAQTAAKTRWNDAKIPKVKLGRKSTAVASKR